MKQFVILLTAFSLAACQDFTAPAGDAPAPRAAVVTADGSIPGHYIVVADWDADAPALAGEYGIAPRHVYRHLLNGFSAEISDEVVQRLAADPRVLRLSVQRQYQALETTVPACSWGWVCSGTTAPATRSNWQSVRWSPEAIVRRVTPGTISTARIASAGRTSGSLTASLLP